VPHLFLRIAPFDGDGTRGGETFASRGGFTRIGIGERATEEQLAGDWLLTHEMVHLAFPSMPDRQRWIEEGIATYVEPIARIQSGHYDAARMWADLVRDMPQGLPRAGDRGLDNTHTWGRTYWGGALFCLRADIEIRMVTHNSKGLQDALRGILDAGGDIREDWDLRKTFEIGDRATGTHVLMNLYSKMGDDPNPVDLDALWKQLGVSVKHGAAQFDDNAPLAAVRRSITSPRT
jgi:hypothetical protein